MPSARAHDGAVIDVHVHGSGPFLLHTTPIRRSASPEDLELQSKLHRALIEGLSDRYRVVLFEYPGQPPKPQTLTPTNVVSDLLAVADAAGARRFMWCGYSWTAVVGLQLALRSDRLSGLVCGGWPPMHGPYREMLRVLQAYPHSNKPKLDSRPADEIGQAITFYRALASFDDIAAQSAIMCPRLCFAGGEDDIYDLAIGRTVRDRRHELEALGWTVEVLDGLDHTDALDPAALVPVVGAWLDRQPEQR